MILLQQLPKLRNTCYCDCFDDKACLVLVAKWAVVGFLYFVQLMIRDRMMKSICVVVVGVGVVVTTLYDLQQWSFYYEKKTKASSIKGNDGFSLCYNSKRVEAQHMMSFPFARWIHHHVSVLPGNNKETKHWWWIESKILTMTCTAGGTESRKFGIESYYSTHLPPCDRCNRTAHHTSDGLPLQLCITFCSITPESFLFLTWRWPIWRIASEPSARCSIAMPANHPNIYFPDSAHKQKGRRWHELEPGSPPWKRGNGCEA